MGNSDARELGKKIQKNAEIFSLSGLFYCTFASISVLYGAANYVL
jgi:hypothetical protein